MPPISRHSAHVEPQQEDTPIIEAVAAEATYMEELAARLIEAASVLGEEEQGQLVMRGAFADLGLETIDVPMDAAAIRAHPGSSPFDWDVSSKTNLVAGWPAIEPASGRSLILNGHVDVVPGGPPERWTTGPFVARREGDWLYGRGAADMKGGLAAIVGAVRGIQRLGLSPLAPVTLQSVVEEECTGNGTLACVIAGFTADAAIVPEPFGASITTSQVGVLWFDVRVPGCPGHAGDPAECPNAIEAGLGVIESLRELERDLNEQPPGPFANTDHPINLNVGAIRGGDWPSTAPDECVISFRIATYPKMPVSELRKRVEQAVGSSPSGSSELAPEVRYGGFACEGYTIDPHEPLIQTLSTCCARLTGEQPEPLATTSTTDARIFGLYGSTPAVCFGPLGEGTHGVDERVFVPSIVQTAQTLALFIRDWCGLAAPA